MKLLCFEGVLSSRGPQSRASNVQHTPHSGVASLGRLGRSRPRRVLVASELPSCPVAPFFFGWEKVLTPFESASQKRRPILFYPGKPLGV